MMQVSNENKEYGEGKPSMPKILKKFHHLMRRNKPFYTEAYKVMAATTDVIKMQFGEQPEYSPTAYFACLQDMLSSQITLMQNGS
jgi:hypothetical protein